MFAVIKCERTSVWSARQRVVSTVSDMHACLQPQWPWCRGKKGPHKGPPFFAKDEKLSLLISAVCPLICILLLLLVCCSWLACSSITRRSCKHDCMQVMGLQHALAMVGGIVTPPLIISYLQKDSGIANCESSDLILSVASSRLLTSCPALIVFIHSCVKGGADCCRFGGSFTDCERSMYGHSRKLLLVTLLLCRVVIKHRLSSLHACCRF